MIDRLRQWAGTIKRDIVALWLASRDRRVSWFAKTIAAAVAVYALSPIDLIPDFIPVLGYLDDLIIVPLGILVAVKLVPPVLMAEFRAEAMRLAKPASRAGLAIIFVSWALAAILLARHFWPT